MCAEIILISWNRSAYLEKTLANLLADPAEFRVYWWDNASEDERTRELFETTKDERIVWKHRHEENVGQREPCLWFFENAESDIVGKIDDDILLPHGWTDRLGALVRADERIGMVGCWIFMDSDWDEQAAQVNQVNTHGGRVLRMTGIAGHSFLMRRSLVQQYRLEQQRGHGIPVDRSRMALDGWISGVAIPPLFAHNMDDPRSEHCVKYDAEGRISALTGRAHGFANLEEYAAWIANDAYTRLTVPYERQLRRLRLSRRPGFVGKIQRKALQKLNLW